jgi:hypothetical protein
VCNQHRTELKAFNLHPAFWFSNVAIFHPASVSLSAGEKWSMGLLRPKRIGNLLSWRVRRVCISRESAGARALLAELDDVNGSSAAAALCVFVLPAERELMG